MLHHTHWLHILHNVWNHNEEFNAYDHISKDAKDIPLAPTPPVNPSPPLAND